MGLVKLKMLSIDAWYSEGCWDWNNHYLLEDGICFAESELTPRKILNALRKMGYLGNESKGKVRVNMHNEICDGTLVEILDHNTGEPIYALSDIH